jgi:hypothetical protein
LTIHIHARLVEINRVRVNTLRAFKPTAPRVGTSIDRRPSSILVRANERERTNARALVSARRTRRRTTR